MTKLCCISDTHNRHEELILPPADCLVHTGDYSMMGEYAETLEFLHWIAKQGSKYQIVFFLSGNHDFMAQDDPESFNELCDLILPANVIHLNEKSHTFDGFTFYGHQFVPDLPNWAFSRSRGKTMKMKTDLIPKCDVLLSHGPPYGILDIVPRRTWRDEQDEDGKWNIQDWSNVGCQDLLERVEVIRPKLHAFGHIHEGHSKIYKNNYTTFINCAVLDGSYDFVGNPMIFEI